jgi:hypothetical protein
MEPVPVAGAVGYIIPFRSVGCAGEHKGIGKSRSLKVMK